MQVPLSNHVSTLNSLHGGEGGGVQCHSYETCLLQRLKTTCLCLGGGGGEGKGRGGGGGEGRGEFVVPLRSVAGKG